jgi:glycerate dehydrogenase
MTMKNIRIIVLDGYTLNPGDLSWKRFEALGNCTIYDRTGPAEVLERSAGAEIILTNKVVLSAVTIEQLPDLKYIGVLATGYNVVDIKAATRHGICVTNIPTYGTKSAAQMVFAHLLNLCQHTADHSNSVKQGRWCKSKDFCFWDYPLVELAGLTMGIVGLGHIGLATAKLAAAFGMRVTAFDVKMPVTFPEFITILDLDTLFRESDVISLHCSLNDKNHHMVNRERLKNMKPTAFLINTSRGQLIDEEALAESLNKGLLAGAGLDVLEKEPPDPSCPLLRAKNCFITPHIAWATRSARQRLMKIAVDNLESFINGEFKNVVNDLSR